MSFKSISLCIAIALAVSAQARADNPAETAVPATTTFDIRNIQLRGNTLIPDARILELVAPYTGTSRNFGDVQQALEALQAEYQRIGHGSVQVLLPEQELNDGTVTLQALEQPLARISVTGNTHFDSENILASLPHVRQGTLPNNHEIARDLRLANENPAKRTSIQFRAGDQASDGMEATVKVSDDKPWKVFLSADNTGSSSTGYGRIGIGFQHYNVGNRDHRFTAQFITNMSWPGDEGLLDPEVKIFGFGYTIPIYDLGDSIDLIAGYSNVDSGTVQNLFNVTGNGRVFGAHYNRNLAKIDNYTHKLRAGLDYHAYRSDVAFGGVNIVPKVTATPFTLAYQGQWARAEDTLAFSLSGSWNVPFAKYGNDDDFANPAAISDHDAEVDYSVYKWSADYFRTVFSDWQLHLGASGQFTGDHLLGGEQFGVGGMTTLRGWREREISGDKGYRYTAEITTPDYGKVIGDKVGLRWTFFTDKAHVNNNDGVRVAISDASKSMQSVGAGLRFNYGQRVVGRLDYAMVIDSDKVGGVGSRDDSDKYMHASLAWIW